MSTIGEYVVGGETFVLEMPTMAQAHALQRCDQRSKAHAANNNPVGVYREFAEMLAVLLGISPEKAIELPIRILIEVHEDMEAAGEQLRHSGKT